LCTNPGSAPWTSACAHERGRGHGPYDPESRSDLLGGERRDGAQGNWNFVYAILVIALSMGIWSRRPWAWWCGFLQLGLSVCWSLFAMSERANLGRPMGMKLIFAILSCVIVGIWGRWWYAQRKHFLWAKEGR
jgi:hypothetical protein